MVAGLLSAVACGGGKSPGTENPRLVFETNVRKAYSQVRACRSPGEHSGLNAFSVWVSLDAATAFAALWESPPGIQRLPEGTIVVKEVYTGTDCDPDQVERWVAMRKEEGFDPSHADWHWQEVKSDGHVASDGATQTCINCHRGGDDATCIGYGDQNGRDYTCTAPDNAPDAGH